MKKVERISKQITGFSNFYSQEVIMYLKNTFGCDGQNANFIIEGEYNESLIRSIAKYLSKYHGELNEYKIWFCKPINSWRLVFGR